MSKSRLPIVATAALALAIALAANGQGNKDKFGAMLKGSSEVPPVDVKATGTAAFTVSGTSVDYKITASGLSGDATAAHIHLGATTASGGVVVGFPAKAMSNDGKGSVTISGSFTAADLKSNPTVKTFDDLLAQMRAGNTYVNIHTAAHPAGEIRGQIAANKGG